MPGKDTGPSWAWDEMLAAFRALGGVADNIVAGKNGSAGLFPADRALPVRLCVPPNLLVPSKAVEYDGERIRIRETADAGKREREFFERYHEAFSWGGPGGWTACAAHLAALDVLSDDVRGLLVAEFGFGDLLDGDISKRTFQFFLGSRSLRLGRISFLAPLLDLANNGPTGFRYSNECGIELETTTTEEVTVARDTHDTLWAFRTFGVVTPEPRAFSLPLRIAHEKSEIRIHRQTDQFIRRGNVRSPRVTAVANGLTLSFLVIGNAKAPKSCRGTFSSVMQEYAAPDIDEVFDKVVHKNWLKFLNLLAALEPFQDAMSVALRAMVHFQLEAMCHCVGRRELEALPLPIGQTWRI